ncbi:D-alanine--D-alanine ligase [Nocardioidaceae bacterium]|nr:D-alanine--D-alanine ligase [Nocardioidaceae bacterium]
MTTPASTSPTSTVPELDGTGGRDGRVVVLAGGLSHERDVSLRSGRRVAEALRDAGLTVDVLDVGAELLSDLEADPPSCVVPLLHGETGEDGAVREVLELLAVPYVGSRPRDCRRAFDKCSAKDVVSHAGIATPTSVQLPAQTFRELGAPRLMGAIVEHLGLPLVVKPVRGGSALGCTVVRHAEDLPSAMVGAYAYGDTALLERFVEGFEVAVAVVEDEQGPRALPVVGIVPDGGSYDYTARYTAGSTEFRVPAPLDASVAERCREVAVTAHTALGLRDLSRSDLIVDADGEVWFLEVNVAPGLTETSTVPLAIDADGLDLGAVMAGLVARAAQRRPTDAALA